MRQYSIIISDKREDLCGDQSTIDSRRNMSLGQRRCSDGRTFQDWDENDIPDRLHGSSFAKTVIGVHIVSLPIQ